jgi:hypothetical protein
MPKDDPDKSAAQKINANMRLYVLARKLAGSSGNGALGSVFAALVGIKTTDGPKGVWQAAAVIYKMLESAEREVEFYLADELDFYLPILQGFRATINPLFWHKPINQFKADLKDVQIADIRHIGQRLKTLVPECTLEDGSLEKILKSIEELRAAIDELNMSEAVKYKLRQRCSAVEEAVANYQFWGADGIEVSFDATTGALLPYVERDAKGHVTIPWKKIGNIVLAISNIIGSANTGYEHVHKAYLALEPTVSIVEQHAGQTIEAIKDKL